MFDPFGESGLAEPPMVSSTKPWGHSVSTGSGALRSMGEESSAAQATASGATTAVKLVSRTQVRFVSTSEIVGVTEAILGNIPWVDTVGGARLVSTRKLLLLSALCGMAILLASAFQLYQIIS